MNLASAVGERQQLREKVSSEASKAALAEEARADLGGRLARLQAEHESYKLKVQRAFRQRQKERGAAEAAAAAAEGGAEGEGRLWAEQRAELQRRWASERQRAAALQAQVRDSRAKEAIWSSCR